MQELDNFILSLLKHNETSALVVEGKNDKKALEELGCKNVYEIDTQLYLLAEKISLSFGSVVILTDLDKKGKQLYGILKEHFTRHGVKVIDEPRELLFETKVTQVEGLTRHLQHQL